MNWLSRLIGKKTSSAVPLTRAAAGKNVALAVVENSVGTVDVDLSHGGASGGITGGVTKALVRDLIKDDASRNPKLRPKAAAIQDIAIATYEGISPTNYAHDMAQAYLRNMTAGQWRRATGLHVFQTHLGPITVYVAYAT